MLAALLLLTTGHWSAPVAIWAKNPITLRWYQTNEHYWVEAAKLQTQEPQRNWQL